MVYPDVEVRACRRLQNSFKLPLPPARNNPFSKVAIAANIIIHLNSAGIYQHAGSTAQVPIIKPAQRHK
jgi:hypothetical protein